MICKLSTIKLSAIARQRHHGFTLVEIVTSLTIMSVLVIAMGSAMLVVSRGMPNPNAPLAENISATKIIDQIAGELQYAFTINSASQRSIDFIVERHGAPVTIKYSWSGLAGDPLVREYDGGAPVDLIPSVKDFNLSFDVGTISVFTTLPTEGGEIELVKYEPVVYLSNSFDIESDNSLGQYFKPTLPVDTVSWRVTRVVFRAHDHGSTDGLTRVVITTADDSNLPTKTVIERALMVESDLTSKFTWRQFTFSDVANIAPEDGLCLVLQWVVSKDSAVIEYVGDPSGFLTTSDAGKNWNFNNDKSLIYYVYGKITMAGQEVYPVNSVKIGLDTGIADTTRIQTTALFLNQPAAMITP